MIPFMKPRADGIYLGSEDVGLSLDLFVMWHRPFIMHDTEGEISLARALELRALDPKVKITGLHCHLVYIPLKGYYQVLESLSWTRMKEVKLEAGYWFNARLRPAVFNGFHFGYFEYEKLPGVVPVISSEYIRHEWQELIKKL